jgi:phage baseplate assembly protein W
VGGRTETCGQRPLRVKVNNEYLSTDLGERTGQRNRGCRLANSTFLVAQ